MTHLTRFACHAMLACLVWAPLEAQPAATPPESKTPTIEEKTTDLRRMDGFLPLYWDPRAGTLWMEIARFDEELLYVTGLSAGLGSNDIGLDRGQSSGGRVVRFQRIGPKVLMVQPNYGYRATSDNPDERLAVQEAFAQSVLWGFTVAAESDGRVLVDLTDFLLRDAHGVTERLRPASFQVERSRSAVYLPRTTAFPQNTELEATLTFVSSGGDENRAGGGQGEGSLGAVTPTIQAVTLRQHHSFVALPGPGYTPRAFDPRAGYIDLGYQDYSAPLGASLTKRVIVRHRLAKRDAGARVSDPVEPIVYYLDRGTPEPVRSALLDGARWWNEAFEAAGYRNAFRVELMPEGADPMDVRYNVIQWVHRSTRGWSYGDSIVDPRTGEIIQGRVTLGSLRVRQDYLIAEGLLSPYETGTEVPPALAQTALARLRQLSAHEVGHTLGLSHNYYDSSQGRISVLDYPHPLARLDAQGRIDLSDAYATGIGAWDKVAIAYGYQDFPPGTVEEPALRRGLDEAWDADLRFLTNQDIDTTPRADQWSNGTDPAQELVRLLAVRRTALRRFGDTAIQRDRPLATMEEALVPLYLHHRYQVEATASALGGLHYTYALRGDGRDPVRPVPGDEQRAALTALAATLSPSELAVPQSVIDRLPPRPMGYGAHRELFPRWTGTAFDPIAPAVVAADHTITSALQPERAARLVAQHDLDPTLPGLEEVVDALVGATFDAGGTGDYERAIARAAQGVLVDRLMTLASGAPMPQVRAVAHRRLGLLRDRLAGAVETGDEGQRAHAQLWAADIARFLQRPAEPTREPSRPAAPPGAPIGQVDPAWLGTRTLQCAGDEDWLATGDAFYPPLFDQR